MAFQALKKLVSFPVTNKAENSGILDKKKAEESKYLIRIIAGYLVIPLYLVLGIADYLYLGTEYNANFFVYRCTAMIMSYFVHYQVTRTERSFNQIQLIIVLYFFGLGLIVNAMIHIMADPVSPYYGNLLIIAFAAIALFPWQAKYFFAVILAIFGPYYLILFNMGGLYEVRDELIFNSFIILGVLVIGWIVRLLSERWRVKELEREQYIQAEAKHSLEMEKELIKSRSEALANAAESEAKTRFLSTISHELRTPLQGIIGYSDMAVTAQTNHNYDEALNNLTHAKASTQHMMMLIEGLLDAQTIQSGKMTVQKESFDVKELCQEVKDAICPLVTTKKNYYEGEVSDDVGYIKTDRIKLKQVMLNLISNANKFTDQGNIKLIVDFIIDDSGKQMLHGTVKDDGIGIPANKLDTVFESFTQVSEGQRKKHKGTGLGLSIVKHFVEYLGGYIKVTSEVGKGSTFEFFLPYEKGVKPTESTFETDSQGDDAIVYKHIKILLAEDDMVIRNLLKQVLTECGHTVDAVDNGKTALEYLTSTGYDFAVIDLHMPRMTGLDIINNLPDPVKKLLPMVIISADTTQEVKDAVRRHGVDIIYKPIKIDTLPGIINHIVHNKRRGSDASSVPTIPSITDIKEHELLDHERIKSLLKLDKTGNFQKKTLSEYIKQTGELIDEFKTSLRHSDTRRVRVCLHTLEGGSGTLGVPGIVEAVIRVRDIVKSEKYDVEPLCDYLDRVYKATVKVINRHYGLGGASAETVA